MSHDRGCHCGREKDEYRTCPKGANCSKRGVIAMWDQNAERCTACPDKVTRVNGKVICPYSDCPMRNVK